MKTDDLSDIVNALERTPTKGIAPVMNLMDVIFPARSITVTCHLQWGGSCADRVGITFEVTDSKKRGGISFTQTLWSDRTNSAKEDKKLTKYYIELLKPAMRWLVLLYWEREVWLDVSNDVKKGLSMLFHQFLVTLGISNNDKEGLHPAFLYMLGALCYVSADHFPVCSNFFNQQAVSWFSKATRMYPNCTLPYYMRAELYYERAKEEKEHASYLQAIRYFDLSLDDSQWTNWEKHSQDIKNLITVKRALAIYGLGDDNLINDTIEQVDDMVKERGDPTTFYSEEGREGCSLYLKNLASWYSKLQVIYNKRTEEQKAKEAQRKVRCYLIYSFVRNPPPWYIEGKKEGKRCKEFEDFFYTGYAKPQFHPFDQAELEDLWKVLEEHRWEIFVLARLKKDAFSQRVETLFGQFMGTGTFTGSQVTDGP